MKRPTKKEIKESVGKLKQASASNNTPEYQADKLTEKKSSQRIRKQGI